MTAWLYAVYCSVKVPPVHSMKGHGSKQTVSLMLLPHINMDVTPPRMVGSVEIRHLG